MLEPTPTRPQDINLTHSATAIPNHFYSFSPLYVSDHHNVILFDLGKVIIAHVPDLIRLGLVITAHVFLFLSRSSYLQQIILIITILTINSRDPQNLRILEDATPSKDPRNLDPPLTYTSFPTNPLLISLMFTTSQATLRR